LKIRRLYLSLAIGGTPGVGAGALGGGLRLQRKQEEWR
jgi:hypothetical protein